LLTEERRFAEHTATSDAFKVVAVCAFVSVLWFSVAFDGDARLLAIPALLGLLIIVGLRALMWRYGNVTVVVCRPDGFTLATEGRRGVVATQTYRWDEVTGTRYYECRTNRRRGRHLSERRRPTTGYFAVDTVAGEALVVSSRMREFSDLVATFNEMTPHLPYVWEPRVAVRVSLGPFSAGRGAYRQAPRGDTATA
jgi:hypothetical protein